MSGCLVSAHAASDAPRLALRNLDMHDVGTYSYPATGRCSERHRCAITDRLEGSSIYRHWLRDGTVVTGELSRRRGDHFRIRALCNPRDQRFRSVSSRKHPIERDPSRVWCRRPLVSIHPRCQRSSLSCHGLPCNRLVSLYCQFISAGSRRARGT